MRCLCAPCDADHCPLLGSLSGHCGWPGGQVLSPKQELSILSNSAERSGDPEVWTPPPETRPQLTIVKTHKPRAWWRRPWVIPLFVAATGFLVYQLPPWLTFDPNRSRIPLKFPLHYWLIVGHVLFGTVAL